VILVHGGVARGKDGPGTVNLARVIARAGWSVLAVDMLYFGERDTGLFETFSNPEKAERLYTRQGLFLDWVTQTVKDVGRAYDVLVDRGVDASRIVYVGVSRGGQMALIAGGADKRLAGVAALIAGHFDAIENGHRSAACPANYIGRISPRPLLMINGNHDADYDKERSVLPLQALAVEPREFHWNDGGHTLPPESTAATLLDWLRRVPSLQ
jgi:dienelactone hydrolase